MKKSAKKRRLLHPDTLLLLKQIGMGLLIIAGITIILTSIWFGTRLDALTITEVVVEGGETISHEYLASQIEDQLRGSYLRFVPRRFAYLYPKDDIIASVAGIPRVKDITLTREGGKKLTLMITEYEPAALWCGEQEVAECLLLDNTTFAFAVAPALSGGTFLRYVSIGEEPMIGSSVLTTSELTNLTSVKTAIKNKGWQLKQVSVDAARDTFLLLADDSELILSLKDDGQVVVNNLDTVLNSDEFTNLVPGEFRYIDLRFGNKVFVNRSEEEVVASTTGDGLVDFAITPLTQSESSEPIATSTDN